MAYDWLIETAPRNAGGGSPNIPSFHRAPQGANRAVPCPRQDGFGYTRRVDNTPDMLALVRVSQLRQILAITLLAVWWTASMHCRLEAITETHWLACEDGEGGVHGTCAEDACTTIEDGFYRPSGEVAHVAPPEGDELPTGIEQVHVSLVRVSPISRQTATAPPVEDLPHWLFAERAAPLPRAPAPVL